VRNWQILSQLNRALLSATSYEAVARKLVEPGREMSFEGVILFAVHCWDEEEKPQRADVYLEFRPQGDEPVSIHFPNFDISNRDWCKMEDGPLFFWEDVRRLKQRSRALPLMQELIERYDIRNALSIHLCRSSRFIGMLIFFARGTMMESLWKTYGDSKLLEAEVLLAETVMATLERLTAERLKERSYEMLSALYHALADINAAGDYDEIIVALQRHTVLGEADVGVGLVAFSPSGERRCPPGSIRWPCAVEMDRRRSR